MTFHIREGRVTTPVIIIPYPDVAPNRVSVCGAKLPPINLAYANNKLIILAYKNYKGERTEVGKRYILFSPSSSISGPFSLFIGKHHNQKYASPISQSFVRNSCPNYTKLKVCRLWTVTP